MNYSGNKKNYFEIYYSEKSAGTSNKYPIFSPSDLESATKSTFQKLVYGLKNEDSGISYMFCSQRPDLEVHLSYYYNHIPYRINILGKNSRKVEVLIARGKKFFWRKTLRWLRYSYQKGCFCQWPDGIYRGYFEQRHPWQILCCFRKLNFYTVFRMQLGRKISLVPKFRKIKFKEITGNKFQGTFSTLVN